MTELVANFNLAQSNIDALFEIKAAGTTWGSIVGNLADQTDLQAALNAKQDIIADLEAIRTGAQNGDFSYSTMLTYGDIVNYNAAAFATAAQGALAETALQKITSGDVTTALGFIPYNSSNPKGYITAKDLNGYALSSDLATVATTGNYADLINKPVIPPRVVVDQVYDSTSINAQSGIAIAGAGFLTSSSLNGYATENWVDNQGFIKSEDLPTVNNNTIFIQKNGINIDDFTLNQDTNKTINITVPTTAADVGALADTTTINDLTTLVQQNALNSGATTTNIGQIATNTGAIAQINTLIPSQATASNQLADKSFVNSSISTNTAYFIGTFNSVAELEAYSGTLTNNDYAFVRSTDSAGNTLFNRYKWNGTQWLFEYELNNSSFTAEQWTAVNSGITSSDVALIATAIQPNDNISKLTNNAGYITSSDLSPYVLSSSLATVATSGDYNDLNNKPTIPTVNNATLTIQKNGTDVQTFTANASSNVTCNITVPTNTNELTNGAGFITGINSSDVTTALGYTPYNSSNPAGYTTNVGTVTSVNNVSPVNGDVTLSIPTNTNELTNGAGFITGINSTDVTTALGYTPVDESLSNLNSTGQALFAGKVSKSGDTMTGLLEIQKQEGIGVRSRNMKMDLDNPPETNLYNQIVLSDKNNKDIGYFQAVQGANSISTVLMVKSPVSSTYNALILRSDYNGNFSFSASDCFNDYVAKKAMPSDKYIDLTLGASGATYTAPANGYFCVMVRTNNVNVNFTSYVIPSYGGRIPTTSSDFSMGGAVVPVLKGQSITFNYEAGTSERSIKFVYAEGAKND